MKKLITILLIIFCSAIYAQVTPSSIIRVANATTAFNDPVAAGKNIVNNGTGKQYLVLLPLANTKTIATCTLGTDIKELIGLTSLSSTVAGLTYTNTTGVFSLTSGYIIPTTTEQTNWNTAYGWGNHASVGYVTGTPWTTMGYLTGTISHAHGNITYTGYIGTAAALPIITGTGGILQAGSFGTIAGTFAAGDHTHSGTYEVPLTFGSGVVRTVNAIASDTTFNLKKTTAASMYQAKGSYVPYSGATGNVSIGTYTITAGNFILSSDKRLKFNIQKLSEKDFSNIGKIDFRKFYMHTDSTELRYGVVADEVLKVVPELVIVPTDPTKMKTVKYIDLLIAVVAQQAEEIKLLKEEGMLLREKNRQLEKRVLKLEDHNKWEAKQIQF